MQTPDIRSLVLAFCRMRYCCERSRKTVSHHLLERVVKAVIEFRKKKVPHVSPESDRDMRDELEERFVAYLKSYPFMEYAALRWSWYFELASATLEGCASLHRFCSSQAYTVGWLRAVLGLQGHPEGNQDSFTSLAQIASQVQESPICHRWLKSFQKPQHSRSSFGQLDRLLQCDRDCAFLLDLHVAAFFDYTEFLSQRIQEGAEVDFRNWRALTPLSLVARADSYSAIEALLQYGADPNTRMYDDRTPLRSALEVRET